MTNLITGIRTVDLEAEKHKCSGRYYFIDADAGVNVSLDVNLNVGVYLEARIKKGIVSDIGKFLSSSARCCSVYCRIAVAVMTEV